MKRSIKIGEHSIPLWLVVVLLISIISMGVLADYLWKTIFLSVEIKEPLEIVSYPSMLSLYPGETEEFNVTLMNHASRNYTVVLDFSLDNVTYQESYVTFSDEIYNVIPGQQNLLAWLKVESYAPPVNTSLTIDFLRIEEELLFHDDFSSKYYTEQHWTVELGNFEVIDGEYFTHNALGEESRAFVDDLNITDCVIKLRLRFDESEVGFKGWIFFRYIDSGHCYAFEVSTEWDEVAFVKWPADTFERVNYPIDLNVDYTLRVEVRGNAFTGFINGEEILSATDPNHLYASGQVGLSGRRADVFFDDFTVWRK